jgi:hypothetical protein
MYFFLIFGLPLGFLLLALDSYPKSEYPKVRGAFARGLVASLPLWLVARILGSIVPPAYGTVLLAFHEWADRTLPYAFLPAVAYLVFYRPGERLPAGFAPRRLTAFYAGALSPVGLLETIRIWGNPDPYTLFFLPFILAASCLVMPKAAAAVHEAYGLRLAALVAGLLALTLVASLGPFLILARLWPLAVLLVAAAGAFSWFSGYPELLRHPPIQLDQ